MPHSIDRRIERHAAQVNIGNFDVLSMAPSVRCDLALLKPLEEGVIVHEDEDLFRWRWFTSYAAWKTDFRYLAFAEKFPLTSPTGCLRERSITSQPRQPMSSSTSLHLGASRRQPSSPSRTPSLSEKWNWQMRSRPSWRSSAKRS